DDTPNPRPKFALNSKAVTRRMRVQERLLNEVVSDIRGPNAPVRDREQIRSQAPVQFAKGARVIAQNVGERELVLRQRLDRGVWHTFGVHPCSARRSVHGSLNRPTKADPALCGAAARG